MLGLISVSVVIGDRMRSSGGKDCNRRGEGRKGRLVKAGSVRKVTKSLNHLKAKYKTSVSREATNLMRKEPSHVD